MRDLAKDVFMQAYRFRSTARVIGDLLKNSDDRNIDLYFDPFVVNASFSIELYLKCICIIESGKKKAPYMHELDKLYDSLSVEVQNKLSDVFIKENEKLGTYHLAKENKPDFEWSLKNVLKESSKAFIKWRYSYEGKLPDVVSIKAVIFALETIIFELREDLYTVYLGIDSQPVQ